jgi:hypothetical protein
MPSGMAALSRPGGLRYDSVREMREILNTSVPVS